MAKFNTVPEEPKSDYELQRDARIAENKRFLAALNLGPGQGRRGTR